MHAWNLAVWFSNHTSDAHHSQSLQRPMDVSWWIEQDFKNSSPVGMQNLNGLETARAGLNCNSAPYSVKTIKNRDET